MRGHLGGGSSLEPFLGSSLLCCFVWGWCRFIPGAHFTDEDVETLSALVGFVQQPLLGSNREEPQPVFPLLLSLHLDCALPRL